MHPTFNRLQKKLSQEVWRFWCREENVTLWPLDPGVALVLSPPSAVLGAGALFQPATKTKEGIHNKLDKSFLITLFGCWELVLFFLKTYGGMYPKLNKVADFSYITCIKKFLC